MSCAPPDFDFEEDPWANELNFCSDAQLPRTLEPLVEPSGTVPQDPQHDGGKGSIQCPSFSELTMCEAQSPPRHTPVCSSS